MKMVNDYIDPEIQYFHKGSKTYTYEEAVEKGIIDEFGGFKY